VDENNGQKKKGQGFAGLSEFVSDVDITIPSGEKKASPNPIQSFPESRTSSAYATSAQIPTSKPKRKTRAGILTWEWVIGGVFVIFVIAILVLNNKSHRNGPLPTPAYSPTTGPSSAMAINSTSSPQQTSLLPPSQQATPSRPIESKPPVGQSVVLSTEQIRYCLAESIRMDGAKLTLNRYSDYDVERFNAMVADYNSRCGSFRYRSGALEDAKRDIEPYRTQLRTEGGTRFPNVVPPIGNTGGSKPALNTGISSAAIKPNNTGITYPTSFDCTKARSIPENLICHDSELAAYDVELGAIYERAKAAAYDKKAFSARTRKQWNYREKNCRDKDCVAAWYAYQRDILTKISLTGNVTAK